MGPQLSMNYFFTHEKVYSSPGFNPYTESDRYLNRLGLGWTFDVNLTGIPGKRASLFSSWTPQVVAYERFYSMGGVREWFILAGVSKIGIKYHLNREAEQKQS